MAFFKCKMCGGNLEVKAGMTVAECEYCGTNQTLPNLADDKKINMYDRANHFRRNNEFDKAMGIYEQILNEDKTDAESYWSLVLCRYGIEYVEDPSTHKRVPTVNRAQYTSIFADEDYKAALQYADMAQKIVYEAEAKAIDEIQKGILEISQKEEPFDVFICYKDTDNNGRRTVDSVLANDLYHQLTTEGFKVFYSRITLEDKLGTAYEPSIFAALNSAKVMVVLGTKPEYFNAVWVKNEWSRYLALIKNGAKKMLIPAYKDMDPYDLPEEFSHLQAQDMSKLGFMQDLIRGISKILDVEKEKNTPAKETVVMQTASGNIEALLERGQIALEDAEWDRADSFYEDVLNQDAKNAEAYIGKALAAAKCVDLLALVDKKATEYSGMATGKEIRLNIEENHIKSMIEKYIVPGYFDEKEIRSKYDYGVTYKSYVESMQVQADKVVADWDNDKLLSRAIKYANGESVRNLDEAKEQLVCKMQKKIEEAMAAKERIEQQSKENLSNQVSNTDKLLKETYDKAIQKRDEELEEKERKYQELCKSAESAITSTEMRYCVEGFKRLNGFRDSEILAKKYEESFYEITAKEKYNKDVARAKSKNQAIKIIGALALILIIGILVFSMVKNNNEEKARRIELEKTLITALAEGRYTDAKGLYSDYDPNGNFEEYVYESAINLMEEKEFGQAFEYFKFVIPYGDSEEYILKLKKEFEGSIGIYSPFFFGTYEQDNNIENGAEEIEWIVLEKNDNQMLLVSKYLLDLQSGDKERSKMWSETSLRKWLNNEFYNKAFSSKEVEQIQDTMNKDVDGNMVTDKVFILSFDEVDKYLDETNGPLYTRTATLTESLRKELSITTYEEGYSWHVRPELGSSWDKSHVYGYFRETGGWVTAYRPIDTELGVRPAIWVSIKD